MNIAMMFVFSQLFKMAMGHFFPAETDGASDVATEVRQDGTGATYEDQVRQA